MNELHMNQLDKVTGGSETNTREVPAQSREKMTCNMKVQTGSSSVKAYCEYCKKITEFRIASGAREYCTVCRKFKNVI